MELKGPDDRAIAWQALPAGDVMDALRTSASGLTSAEAADRLARHGPNRLPQEPAAPWWRIAARQFASPLILVLALAAALCLVIGSRTDAVFIAVVLVTNALIGGSLEWRAERGAQALRRLLQFRALVERDGAVREVPADGVVPGDVIWLESGYRVPADARLLSAPGLEVDESLLTGESVAVEKDPQRLGTPSTPLADRLNMVHAGTIVVRGRAKAVVTATGAASSIGQLAIDVAQADPGRPPLLLRLDRFARAIGLVSLLAVVSVALVGVVGHGRSIPEMAIFGIALAVSVIPEGLPVAITVALAVASSRMARRGVIVRRLGAVEGLGSCTLIASDKTGTLTCNQLTVREIHLPGGRRFSVTGEGFAPRGEVHPEAAGAADAGVRGALEDLALVAALCNEADLHQRDGTWTWRGDPTDVALLAMAHKIGPSREPALDAHPEVNRIPFEPEHRFAATFHRYGSDVRVLVKGAPERVLSMCSPDDGGLAGLAVAAEQMAQGGLRVLALAEGPAPAGLDPTMAAPQPSGLRAVGLVGMIDPLRPGVPAAVRACGRAGIGVCMVTGDHPTTALAIARDLGIADAPGQVVTGGRFEAMPADELRSVLAGGRIRVFARVAPHQKLRLVESARAAGHFVAVTGDGANDAPALRAANIGVAMGRGGTDIARDASDLVISDDDFSTIVAGVEEGRVAYDNIRKVIFMLVSTGGAEMVMTVMAVIAGLPLPLLPAQLLWLNLVTNGIQDVALALEPGEPDVLERPPRPPGEPIFNRLMVERSIVAAAVIGMVSFGAFWWMLEHGWTEGEARNALLLLMVLFESVHLGNCRSETRSALRLSPLRSPVLLSGTLGAIFVHVLAMHLPGLRSVLKTEPVSAEGWAALLALALTVFLASELHKAVWRVMHPGPPAPPAHRAPSPRPG